MPSGVSAMALNARQDLGDRNNPEYGTREAVRGLHQGLARLANQVATTTGNSAYQLGQLASGLEEVAGRVSRVSADSDEIWRMLKRRLSRAEKAALFNINALGKVLEKVEACANQRATDRVDHQLRTAQHEQNLRRVEDALARLEQRTPGVEFERRMGNIERLTGDIIDRLTDHEARNMLDAPGQAMAFRIAALENTLAGLDMAHAQQPQVPEAVPPQTSKSVEPPPILEPVSFRNAAEVERSKDGLAWELPPAFAESLFGSQATMESGNFLSQARRSVRDFPDGHGEPAKARYRLPVVASMVVVLIAATAYILMLNSSGTGTKASSGRPAAASYNVTLRTAAE